MNMTAGRTDARGTGLWMGWLAGLLVGLFAGVASAQVPRPDAPSTRTVNTPEAPAKPTVIEERPRSRRMPGGEKQMLPKLEGVIIVKSEAELKTEGVPVSPGLHVVDIPLLAG